MKTQPSEKKQNLNFGQDHRSKNILGGKQGMETPKSGRSSLAAPRSPAPFPKRRKGLPFVDEDISSGSRASALFGSRDSRREQTLFLHSLVHLSSVRKYCIQTGVALSSWLKPGVGIPWVSVHGIDSICVVVRHEDMCRLRKDQCPHYPDYVFVSYFWNTIISEVEDIAAPSGESRQLFNKSSKKPFGSGPSGKSCQMLDKCSKSPFGVVSVITDTNKAPKPSSAEYDAEKAIKYLQEEMESGSVFTFDKTTQTAIFAFWHLFRQEIEADDIQAFVLKNDEPFGRELKPAREDSDIEEFLSIINGA